MKYEWSDVRVYVSASLIGVELTGDLRYTSDGCTATYHVAALSPAVPCADGSGKPDATLCNEDNGVSSDLAVTCDPVFLHCVLTSDHPF